MVRKVREGGWRWKCCWDAETVIQAAERGTDTYECTHTNIASHGGEGAEGTGTLHTSLRVAWPAQGGLVRPSRPCDQAEEKAKRGRWWSEPGGPGLDWLGWRLSLVSWWGRPEPGWTQWGSASVLSSPGSQCPSHRGQTSVSGVSGVTLRHTVLVVCWEFIVERSENRGWLLFESVYYGD